MGEGVDEIAVGLCLEALQRHGTAGGIADEAFHLIAAMRRNRRVGVQGKAVYTGATRTGEPGRLALRAKPCTNAPDRLASLLPPGKALLHGGRHGTGQRGFGIHQGVIACRHRGVETRFQVSQMAEFADDPMADFLDHVGDVGVGRGLAREKAWFATLVGTIEIDPFKEKQ